VTRSSIESGIRELATGQAILVGIQSMLLMRASLLVAFNKLHKALSRSFKDDVPPSSRATPPTSLLVAPMAMKICYAQY
jgi:hypothetical protein